MRPGIRGVVGICALLLVLGGGATGVVALPTSKPQPQFVAPIAAPATALPAPAQTAPAQTAPAQTAPPPTTVAHVGPGVVGSPKAAHTKPTATRVPGRAAPATATGSAGAATAARVTSTRATIRPASKTPAKPVITTRTETKTRKIPYATRLVRDPSLSQGLQQVQSPGVAGEKTLRYLVTLTNGHPSSRHLLDSITTRKPKQRVVVLGSQSRDQWDDQGTGVGPGWGPEPWWDGDQFGHCGALCLP